MQDERFWEKISSLCWWFSGCHPTVCRTKNEGESICAVHLFRCPLDRGESRMMKQDLSPIWNGTSQQNCDIQTHHQFSITGFNECSICFQVSSLNGIFHYSGTEQKTKYEMALAMAEIFNITTEHIIADKESVSGAKRPYDTRLDSSRLELLGIGQRTPFKEAIKKCLEPFYSTK